MVFAFILVSILTALVILFYVLAASFVLWMLVDAAKQDKIWWVVLIVGVPIIGAIVYFFTEKKHEYAKINPDCEHCQGGTCPIHANHKK